MKPTHSKAVQRALIRDIATQDKKIVHHNQKIAELTNLRTNAETTRAALVEMLGFDPAVKE